MPRDDVGALITAAVAMRAALDNYLSYSPSRRDDKALSALMSARDCLVKATVKARTHDRRVCDFPYSTCTCATSVDV
jgi:hypothetical protein